MTTNANDTGMTFDVYVFGSRSAATAALTCATLGDMADAKIEALEAARQHKRSGEAFTARNVASRINGAARRAGLTPASETVLARRIVETLKGKAYGTMPYGDDDRIIVFVPTGGTLPLTRTLKANAEKRIEAARPALAAASAMRPRQLTAA